MFVYFPITAPQGALAIQSQKRREARGCTPGRIRSRNASASLKPQSPTSIAALPHLRREPHPCVACSSAWSNVAR